MKLAIKKKKQQTKHEIDMVNGPVLGKMLIFALPLMMSSILQLLFNAADIIVVGRWAGDNSLAAVGSTASLINLMVNLFVGLAVGANVLTAKFFGAKKRQGTERDRTYCGNDERGKRNRSGRSGYSICRAHTQTDAVTAKRAETGGVIFENIFPRYAGNDDIQFRQRGAQSQG